MKRKRDNSSVNGNLLRKPIRRWFPLFMGPMVAAFCIGFVWPFLQGIYLSFCQFKITKNAKWVG